MRRTSAKRARSNVERRRLARLVEPQACPRCHREAVVDLHELTRQSQSSTSRTDVEEIVPLGRACHDWVGQHPTEAVTTGWAKWAHRENPETSWLDRL